MDPLSISASIIAVMQVTGTIISYLSSVRDAPEDRMKFAMELSGLNSLLSVLHNRVKDPSDDPWFITVQGLGVRNGPLDQFMSSLVQLKSKLEPVKGLKQAGKILTWHFDKREILDILSAIERIKTLVSLALENDLFTLARRIKAATSGITEGISGIRRDVSNIMAGITEIQLDEERSTIIDWLSDFDFRKKQSDVFEKRTDGTGQWLLESQEFKGWLVGNSETLWCPGIPGGGKTIILSIVIDHLQTLFGGENVAIVCIYCNYKEQTTQTVPALLASLLKQLVQDRSTPSNCIKNLYRDSRGARPKVADLITALQSEIRMYYSRVFIVIDALDECPEGIQGALVVALGSLGSAVNVNLMVASRPLPSIQQLFQHAKRLDIYATDEDVRKYIEGRIQCEPRLLRLIKTDLTLQDSIVNKIVANVKGMFLLAKFHVDSLVSKSNRRAIHNALERLPAEVNATYDEAMVRIRGQVESDRELAQRVLSWTTYARGPLSLKELQHALAVSPEMTDMDFEAIEDELNLISVCAGLIVIDEVSNTISLVHYTTQEYFENNRDLLFPDAQASIAATCLTYLSYRIFGNGDCSNDQELESLLEGNPLLKYAALNWGYHAGGKAEESSMEIVLNFLAKKLNMTCASQVLLKFSGYMQTSPNNFCGMHLLSFFGLHKIIHFQLEKGATADSKDAYGQTPLSLAAKNGDDVVTKLLVTRDDIEVNSKDMHGRSPLSWAAENGHEVVVRLLMARGDIEANSQDTQSRSPLSYAAGYGRERVVRLFVSRDDIDVNSEDRHGRSALSWAAEKGHDMVVGMLVARDDVEVNLKDTHGGRSPLSYAAGNGHEVVVRSIVVREDADVNSKDKYGHSPLSLAAENGHERVVRLLVERDNVEVNLKDTYGGRSPLSLAAEYGFEMVVKLLVARDDVDVNSKSVNGRVPLWFAAGNGHEAVVRLLLAREDIDVNAKDSYGRSPLWFAAEKGHEMVVRLLLARNDIDVNSKDNDGHSPLSYAARHGHEVVVRLLLEREDIEVDSRDTICQRSPLSFAAEKGHEKVVALLMTQDDVKVDFKETFSDRSPLSFAAEFGHVGVVKLLMKRDDVDVDSKHLYGRSPLSFAAGNGHVEVVKLLVARDDVEADSKHRYSRSPLSFAAGNGHEAVVKLLIARDDVEVNSKDNSNRSPLSYAMENGHETVGKLLLSAMNDWHVSLQLFH